MNFLMMTCGLFLILLTVLGNLELLFISLGALFKTKKSAFLSQSILTHPLKKLALIIPAHNEAYHIQQTLQSIKKCAGQFDTIVIADNCTDQTAALALANQVRVLYRTDEQHRGKNFALDYAFNILLKENYDIFVILDADTLVESNLITVIQAAFEQPLEALQVHYSLSCTQNTPKERLLYLAFLAVNYLRPLSKQAWGLSTGILGNGFALSRQLLLKVPYQVDSIVEDMAYHIRLVRAGYRVFFSEETAVRAEMPPSQQGVAMQRARWEGGRIRQLIDSGPDLIKEIFKGQWRLFEPFLDLALLPLTYHIAGLLLLVVLPFPFLRYYGLFGLSCVTLYLALTLSLAKEWRKNLAAIGLAPFYVLWKILILPKIFKGSKKKGEWTRTERRDITKE